MAAGLVYFSERELRVIETALLELDEALDRGSAVRNERDEALYHGTLAVLDKVRQGLAIHARLRPVPTHGQLQVPGSQP